MDIEVRSSQKREIIDITDRIKSVSPEIAKGMALISTPHTTAALFVSELDDELRSDLIRMSERLFETSRPFTHRRNGNPNAEAHLLSALAGTSVMLPVEDGRLRLGSYQRIVLFELDGPKARTVSCLYVG